MGLFANLFGNAGKDIDGALDKMKYLADDLASVKYADEDEKKLLNNQPAPADSGSFSATFTEEEGPSGDSWGPTMPAEPNQFNSGLSYQDYFSKVFKEAFPEYQVDREEYKQGKGTIFTFFLNGQKKLVTEVVSCSTYRYALAKKCRQEGIPHLRYYYDYDGWWNTESYVVRRTAKYLGIDIKEIKA